jgi:hypothetical protein
MVLCNCELSAFVNKVKSGRVKPVIIGAGANLHKFQELSGCLEYASAIGDNRRVVFENDGKSYKVLSVEEALALTSLSVVLLTPSDFVDLFYQTERLINNSHTEVYIFDFMLHVSPAYRLKDIIPNGIRKIPKKLHYIWFGKKQIPPQNREWLRSWEKHCPDYEIKFWNEQNYDVSKNPYMKQAYEAGYYGFAPDYARLDIIYNEGGIYFDTDVEVIRDLDDLLRFDAFFARSGIGENNTRTGSFLPLGSNIGSGIGAGIGAGIIGEMIKVYDNCVFIDDDGVCNLSNCDFYQDPVLLKYGFTASAKPQIIQNMFLAPVDVFSPLDTQQRMLSLTENTRSIHHFDASWFDDASLTKRQARIKKEKEFFSKHPIEYR